MAWNSELQASVDFRSATTNTIGDINDILAEVVSAMERIEKRIAVLESMITSSKDRKIKRPRPQNPKTT